MEVTFSKYHGAGNDFIFLDNRECSYKLTNLHRQKMCNRHFGIGADGLVEIHSSDKADFKLIYFNSNGKEGTLCGNGSRCAVAFAKKIGLKKSKDRFNDAEMPDCKLSLQNKATNTFRANVQSKIPQPGILNKKPGDIRDSTNITEINKECSEHNVLMTFTFEASDGLHTGGISEIIKADRSCYSNVFFINMRDVDLDNIKIYSNGDIFVNTGSPHHVTFLDSPIESVEVYKYGRKMRYSLYGTEGSNINFVSRFSKSVKPQLLDNDEHCDNVTTSEICTSCGTQIDPKHFQAIRHVEDGNDDELRSKNDNCLFVRTYERGVEDETLACGTGSVAVAIADYIKQGIEHTHERDNQEDGSITLKHVIQAKNSSKFSIFENKVENLDQTEKMKTVYTENKTIKMPGGCLFVRFSVKDKDESMCGNSIVFSDIRLYGPAEHIFDGIFLL